MTSRVAEEQTLYGVLGVPADASPADIRAAYREALLALHPDKRTSGTSATEADAFLRLHSAWQVLKDAELRAAYDMQLLETGHEKGLFISAEVDLDDMEGHMSKDGRLSFSHPCWCGQAFACAESDLSETADSLLVQCQGCSLIIRVLYTVDGGPL